MRRVAFAALSFLGSAVMIFSVAAQPPGGGGDEKPKKEKKSKDGKAPKFAPGNLFPPSLREELKLTVEQEKAIATIEKDVKEKLEKLLTADQKKTIEEFRPRPPMGGPPEGAPMPKEKKEGPQAKIDGGIQWYATLDAGLAEAARTGKPILFLSAAPHCGGVPGMW